MVRAQLLGHGHAGLSHNDKRTTTAKDKGAGAPIANGWSRTGQLIVGDTARIVNLQAGPKGDVPSKIYTVMFSLAMSPEAIANQDVIACEAEIISVSGHAQMVRVVMSDVTDLGFGTAGDEYKVSVIVSEGTRPTLPYPPTLYPSINDSPVLVAAGATVDIAVPQNAGIGSVAVNVINAASGKLPITPPVASIPEQQAIVQHIEVGGATILKGYDCRQTDWVPLAPGTALVRLMNGSTGIDMIFSLTWGIDG